MKLNKNLVSSLHQASCHESSKSLFNGSQEGYENVQSLLENTFNSIPQSDGNNSFINNETTRSQYEDAYILPSHDIKLSWNKELSS